jgi:hypothetical protein
MGGRICQISSPSTTASARCRSFPFLPRNGKLLPHANFVATIHHGIPADLLARRSNEEATSPRPYLTGKASGGRAGHRRGCDCARPRCRHPRGHDLQRARTLDGHYRALIGDSPEQERAYAKTGPLFSTACFILCPCRTMASLGAIPGAFC